MVRGITDAHIAGLTRQPEKDQAQEELALPEKAPTEAGAINHAVKGRGFRDQITLATAGIRLS